MAGLFGNFVDPSSFTPHGFCLAWEPGLLWLEAGSDALIAVAYYSIPLTLAYFVTKRQDLAFRWIFVLFAVFIMACGTTHVLGVLTLWVPAYWTDGAVKALTALVSCFTAVALWPLLPKLLALPSPLELQRANEQLGRHLAEREVVTRKLADSEARNRALFTRAPVALHTLDMNARIVTVSDQWLELLGYAREEVIGRSITDFLDTGSAEHFQSEWLNVFQASSLRDLQRRYVRKSGAVIDALVSVTVARDRNGQVSQVISSVTDITARKQAEAALRASEERLRQAEKMEAVGRLTGGIAHDFNNVLTVIVGSMELLKRRIGDDERAGRLIEASAEAAVKASKLTSQLLSFSRRQRLEPQVLDPMEIVRGMEPLLARSLPERIRLVIEAAPAGNWRCVADRNQLEAALLNLVLNARDAIPAEGTVSIGCAAQTVLAGGDSGEDDLAPGDYVCISVTDDGSGMDEEVRRRAFEPFFTTKPPGEGSGLGLAQIYGFVRQSGGTARIMSAPGAGTRIEMLLPRALDATPHPPPPPIGGTSRERAGKGERILLAEDEPQVRELAAEALRELGYDVLEASDVSEALRLAAEADCIDLLFTDVMMPGSQTGVDLALELRRERPNLPVLFATGYSDRAVLSRWPDEIRLLAKPYAPTAMAQEVRACLDEVEA